MLGNSTNKEGQSVEMKAPRPKIRYCWFRKFGNTFLRLDLDEGTVAWIDHATPQYIQLEGFDRNSVVLDADTFCNIATCFEAIPYAPTMALRRRQLRERLEELEKLIRFFPRDVSGWQPHASFPTTRRGATESAAASALPLSGSSTASSPSVRKISTVLVGQGGSAAVLRIGADGGRGHAVRTLYRNGGTVVADAVALLATRATDDDFQQLGAPEPSIGATVAAALKRLHSQLVGQRTWSSMSERLLAMQKAAWAIAEKRSGGAARSPYRRRRLSSEIAQGFLCPHCHSEFVAMDTLLEHVQLCQPSDDVLKASDSRTYWRCTDQATVRNKPRGWASYTTRQMEPGEVIVEVDRAEFSSFFGRKQTWISFADPKDGSHIRWVHACSGQSEFLVCVATKQKSVSDPEASAIQPTKSPVSQSMGSTSGSQTVGSQSSPRLPAVATVHELDRRRPTSTIAMVSPARSKGATSPGQTRHSVTGPNRSKSMVAAPPSHEELVKSLSGLVGGKSKGQDQWLGENDEEERITFLETLARMQLPMPQSESQFHAARIFLDSENRAVYDVEQWLDYIQLTRNYTYKPPAQQAAQSQARGRRSTMF